MAHMAEIDVKLRNKQFQLEQRAASLSEELKSVALPVAVHQGQAMGSDVEVQLLDGLQQELQQVQHAILRIKQGVYQQCEMCEGAIEARRLMVLPYTALCSKCSD